MKGEKEGSRQRRQICEGVDIWIVQFERVD